MVLAVVEWKRPCGGKRVDRAIARKKGGRGRWIRTRSCSVVEAPCIEAPPAMLTLVFGAGDEVLDVVRDPVWTLGRSEINGPEADGGFFELPDTWAGTGS